MCFAFLYVCVCISVVEQMGAIFPFHDDATVTFYETCDDCLSMKYCGNLGHLLFSYSKTHTHTQTHIVLTLSLFKQPDTKRGIRAHHVCMPEPYINTCV